MLAIKNPACTLSVAALLLLCACPRKDGSVRSTEQEPAAPPPTAVKAPPPTAGAPDESAAPPREPGDRTQPSSVEACVDSWLRDHQLDRYGNPEGTMYAGGTPLFDERTGKTTDRLTYVFSRRPEARAACGGDAGAATGTETR